MSKFANFVAGGLFSSVGPSALSMLMVVPPNRNLPASPAGELARLVLMDDPRQPTKFEVIGYRGYSPVPFRSGFGQGSQGIVLSGVTRGMDGTDAEHWLAGAYMAQDLPAALMEALKPGQAGEYLAYDGSHLRPRALTQLDLAGNPFADGPILLSGAPSVAAAPAAGAILGYQINFLGTSRLYARFANGTTVTIHTL